MKVDYKNVRGRLTNCSGLLHFSEMMQLFGLRRQFNTLLPNVRKSKSIGKRHWEKSKALILGFINGADCLDDMNKYFEEQAFVDANDGHSYHANTLGKFLTLFERFHWRQFNELMIRMALKMRKISHPDDRLFVLDVDSTIHRQYGKKMEGAAMNYNSVYGYDSLQAYDQHGYQYWMQVRKGGTHTANGARTVISKVFSRIPRMMHRYLRGDSGYANSDVFNECADRNVSFVIAARINMYEGRIPRITNWKRCKKTKFRDGRECEIGSTLYRAAKGSRETIRVVVIRAINKNASIFDADPYDYHGWFTNIGEHEMKGEDVIEFYRGRGNAENHIKELKNGYDIHHFPCQKLVANQMYGVFAAFAYNLARFGSWMWDKETLRLSKNIRFRLVHIPALVVKTGRKKTYYQNNYQRKEVDRWMKNIRHSFGFG